MQYACAHGRAAVVMEIKMGMADRGAKLCDFSQYPFEGECIFPSFTALEVVGTSIEGAVLIVNVRPTISKAVTIEQLLSNQSI